MIRIEEIALPFHANPNQLLAIAANLLNLKEKEILHWQISNRAIDSRNKNFIRFIYTIDLQVAQPDKTLEQIDPEVAKKHRIRIFKPYEYLITRE